MKRLLARLFAPQPSRPTNRPLHAARRPYRPRFDTLELRDCPAALLAPTGVQAIPQGPTQATLTWTDVAEETGYHILHWDGQNIIQVATVPANTTSFTVDGLQPAMTEYLAVEAYRDTGATAQSAWAAVDMPADPVTQPTNLAVTDVTNTAVTLTWGDSQGETGYRVYQWDGTQPVLIATLPAGTTSTRVTGLAGLTRYYFYVEAFNNSNSVATAWLPVLTSRDPITAPGNYTIKAVSGTQIDLKWTDAAGETGYHVYQYVGTKAVLLATLPAGATSFSAKFLQPGKLYWFYVEAFNASNLAISGWKSITTPAVVQTLKPPTNVVGTKVSATVAQVTWSLATGSAGYRIMMWDGATWRVANTTTPGVGKILIGGLSANKTYWFVVQSFTAGYAQVANSASVFVNM
jgi:hypothetical protein